ncbi:MAG: TIR domain-containing protein [Bacillota bacterium]
MSVDQICRALNQLDNELATLEKKLAELAKKEAEKTMRINETQKSITKSTSPSMFQSKMRQIQGYNNELVKIVSDKANTSKQIADKRKKRADTAIKLQKEEADAAKKASKAQQAIQSSYEKQISDLTSQIMGTVTLPSPPQHLYAEDENVEYDVFLSHASEDKEGFADELCHNLKEYGFKVWYDALSIAWGDSLRAKIDAGLRKSRYGIVVISKHYIQKGWTQYELDGLFQKEMTGGKTILPIWHDITKQEVQDFSPTLAGRKALNTAMFTAREIADELNKLFAPDDSLNEQDDDSEEERNGQNAI